MTRVVWSSPAAADLADIARFLAADSMLAAKTFVDRVDEAVRRLADHPRMGRLIPELERENLTMYREIVITPWRVIYKLAEHVIVLAVIDGRRNLQDTLLRRLTRD